MSDNKKVIHVKDLVIKAENVRIEPAHRPEPLFGGRRSEVKDRIEETKEEHDGNDEHHEKDDHHDKPPFSWI